jgi:hypothetical protein
MMVVLDGNDVVESKFSFVVNFGSPGAAGIHGTLSENPTKTHTLNNPLRVNARLKEAKI